MLAIHRGSLDMHGAPHRFTWTRLNSTAEAGDDPPVKPRKKKKYIYMKGVRKIWKPGNGGSN